jgi:predicted RNase H-like HicB family nuclease
MRNFTAYIEKDEESGLYTGIVPSISGAHTCAETLDELHIKLKEVVSLCLEEMDNEEINSLPTFVGLAQL